MSYYSYNNGGGFFSSIPPVTKNIIIINVLVWIMAELRPDFMYETFSLFYPTSPFFKPWQIVTHMFMHGGFWHIFFNMYTLFIFGCVLERMWGPKKFLLFYFVTGLGAALLHTGVQAVEMQVYMSQAAEGSVSAGSAYRICHAFPGFGADTDFPAGIAEGQMVCYHFRCYRTCYGNIRNGRRCSSLCTSRRYAVRMASYNVLEEKAYAL